MWFNNLGLSILDTVILRTPYLVANLTTKTLFTAWNFYNYNNSANETKQLHIELQRIRFELEELRNPEWVIVN
tara:strand:+ start:310 stop:528 length:219 start_codon:yes stop_codon:yes gene_type:complete